MSNSTTDTSQILVINVNIALESELHKSLLLNNTKDTLKYDWIELDLALAHLETILELLELN